MRRCFSIVVLLLALVGSSLPGPGTGLAQGQIHTDSMDSADPGHLSTDSLASALSFSSLAGRFVPLPQLHQGLRSCTGESFFATRPSTCDRSLALVGTTPTAEIQPTASAGTTSGQLAPLPDPHVSPAGTLNEAFTISMNVPADVSIPRAGFEIPLSKIYKLPAGVQLSDFYTEFFFTTPALPAGTGFLLGFCFWIDSNGNCHDIYIVDDGTGNTEWGYGYFSVDGDYQLLQSGDMPPSTLDPTPGATNFLGLTVYQGVAILSGNTYGLGAVIPLEGTPVAGDVQAIAEFVDLSSSGVTAPLRLTIAGFSVWNLSSEAAA